VTPVCVGVKSLPGDDVNVEDLDDVGNVVRTVATSLADVDIGADFTTITQVSIESYNRDKDFCNNTSPLLWLALGDVKYQYKCQVYNGVEQNHKLYVTVYISLHERTGSV